MYVISLGGSVVVPDELDTTYLKKVKHFFEIRLKRGDSFVIVVGGGKLCRRYQKAARDINSQISDEALDWVGIEATQLNAALLRSIFEKDAYPEVLSDYEGEIDQSYPLYLAAGFVPGHSTDLDAVKWAEKFEADTVLNLTNVDYVYDKDPDEHEDAEPLENLTWDEYGEVFGFEWEPGLNSPFDPVAAKAAKEAGLKVVILDGKGLENIQNFLEGGDFKGTVICG